MMRAGLFTQFGVSTRDGGVGFKGVEVGSFILVLNGVLLGHHLRVLPECLNIFRGLRGISTGSGDLVAKSTAGDIVASLGGAQHHIEHLVLTTDHI